ncbi:hypothetical protein LSH36_262g01005 [Paralvinella palmiformis]|uniref:Uncharacterized protein n=1 Tax=Paralvinella palmiformis TaxID=53620 RepID=A0AAD9JKG0_9ANNE|nr:hypothetical protein LSH36_262g01005 [Paralvinella palmiformis]
MSCVVQRNEWGRGRELPCVCYVEGDPLVQSYDKTLKLIIDEQKTLLSRGMNPDKYDRCKFQSRVQTDDDYPGKEGQVYVTWVAFSFGIHKKPKKFLRAIQIFQDQVLIRGHGVRGQTTVELPYTYTTHRNPSGDPVTVRVREEGNTVILESDDCPWRLEFVRGGFDSKIRLAVGARYKPENNDGHNMDGICGNCDGQYDYVLCGEQRTDVSEAEDKFKQISESCADGKHQHKD